MADEDDREALLRRVYSRASLDEEPTEHVDGATGEHVWMSPSAWALRERERERAVPRDADEPSPAAIPPTSLSESGTTPRPDARPRRAWIARTRGSIVGVAIGFVAGVLGAFAVGAATVERGSEIGVPNDPQFPALDPGAAATDGFQADSFRLLTGPSGTLQLYPVHVFAAIRDDDARCFVAVRGDVRINDTCATAQEIAGSGLRFEQPIDAAADLRMKLVVQWRTDGTITSYVTAAD